MIKKGFKSICVLLIVCMMCLSLGVFAQTGQPHIYADSMVNANIGETFELNFYIENNSGILGFMLSIAYDDTLVEPVAGSDVVDESFVPTIVINPRYMNKPEARVAAMHHENFGHNGKMFSYKFMVKSQEATTTNIGISLVNNSLQSLVNESIANIDCAVSSTVVQINSQADVPTSTPTPPPSNSGAGGPILPNTKAPSASFKENAKSIRYIAPISASSFEPDRAATRYEVALALHPLLKFENLKNDGIAFSDVSIEYNNMIGDLAQTPIISGYPDGTFKGENSITRAEFVKMVASAIGLEKNIAPKTKLSDISGHWAQQYIEAFVDASYVYGYPDGSFRPEDNITRAEVVAIINRVINKADKTLAEPVFEDLSSEHWAYDAIMEAVVIK